MMTLDWQVLIVAFFAMSLRIVIYWRGQDAAPRDLRATFTGKRRGV